MKVENKKPESFYILGYLLELIMKIWQFGKKKKKKIKIWQIWVISFSMKTPL